LDTTTRADYKVTNSACLGNEKIDFVCEEISRKWEFTITLGMYTPM
jgi:hypothetical protein